MVKIICTLGCRILTLPICNQTYKAIEVVIVWKILVKKFKTRTENKTSSNLKSGASKKLTTLGSSIWTRAVKTSLP